jgi:uncharacterized linocin/CFP29 family protein
MSDNCPPLSWTTQQWAALYSVAQEAAQKSRVASRFLPAEKASPEAQTVPANWLNLVGIDEARQRGEAEERLQVSSGKTLQLTTISCKVYLRGSEVADPELLAAKSMVRRAAEVLARLEDAIVFNGLPKAEYAIPERDGKPIVVPVIYDISGGRDLTGLLQAPDTLWDRLVKTEAKQPIKAVWAELSDVNEGLRYTQDMIRRIDAKIAAGGGTPGLENQKALAEAGRKELAEEHGRLRKKVKYEDDDIMSVRVEKITTGAAPRDPKVTVETMPVVKAVIDAVQKLERRGHYGPFAVVFGDKLFQEATSPAGSASVLPSQSILPFLQGGDLHRSSTIPPEDGVVVALGGAPVELVVGTDIDVKFLQVSLEPRYVLRVYERFVLRIKELDAVCRLTRDEDLLDENFVPRKANS